MELDKGLKEFFKEQDWNALSNFTIDVCAPKNNAITNEDIKIEFDDTESQLSNENEDNEEDIEINYCDNCKVMYKDYCVKCTMLSRILDAPVKFGVKNRAKKTLPKNILEIKSSPIGGNGIFAVRLIPESVIFGPYPSLSINENGTEYSFDISHSKDCQIGKQRNSNWMGYINLAKRVIDQNLRAFQYKDSLYFQSIKQINKGQELLIFYGIDFDADEGNDYEPPVHETKDVYACVSCCLGFCAEKHLMNHKKNCPFDKKRDGISKKITYCPTCELHVFKEEFLCGHKVLCENVKKSRSVLYSLLSKELEVGLRKFTCPKCKYVTSCFTTFEEHCNQHQPPRKSSKTASSSATISLSSDDEIIVEGKKQYKCPICEKLLSSKGSLTKHKFLHQEKKFTCPSCNKKFSLKRNLKIHQMTHTGEKKFFCAKCDYGAIYKNTLELHIKNVHFKDSIQKTYECNSCPFKTNGSSSFRKHIRMHLGIRKYKCDICDKAFRLKDTLNNHKLTHSEERNILCSKCDKTFKMKEDLKTHMFHSHTEKPYQCDYCNYKSITKENFDIHMKSRHPDGGVDKKFKCAQCKYQTNDKGNLNKHINNHNGYRPFVCEICGQGYLLKNNLRIHLSKHTGERKYKCDICGKTFVSKQTLALHLTSHTGDRRFKCSQCDFKTNNEQSMYRHNLKQHGNQ